VSNAVRYQKLRQDAGENFFPQSAFMFFEEQYNELRSDHGLKEKDFFECNQQASTPVHLPTSPAAVEYGRGVLACCRRRLMLPTRKRRLLVAWRFRNRTLGVLP
jgi:hypothetical protein